MRCAPNGRTIAVAGLCGLALLVGGLAIPHPALGSAADSGADLRGLPATLRWSQPVVRIVIVRDANWTPGRQERACAGFREWKPFVGKGGLPRFIVLSSPCPDGDVNVTFVPNGTLGGKSVGLTRWRHGNGEIGSATILLSYGGRRGDWARQRSTAAHELGHALGITYHSPADADLMYSSSVGKSVGLADVERLRMSYAP